MYAQLQKLGGRWRERNHNNFVNGNEASITVELWVKERLSWRLSVRQNNRVVAYHILQRDGCIVYVLHMDQPRPTRANQKWPKSDLLFLCLSPQNGMAISEIAGFLGRSEHEVLDKFEELRRSA